MISELKLIICKNRYFQLLRCNWKLFKISLAYMLFQADMRRSDALRNGLESYEKMILNAKRVAMFPIEYKIGDKILYRGYQGKAVTFIVTKTEGDFCYTDRSKISHSVLNLNCINLSDFQK